MKVVIAGGSGFLGVSLACYLTDLGHSVVILSRGKPSVVGPWEHVAWDARTLGVWQQALEDSDGLVNLTGRSVNCIKSADNRDEILRSRVESTLVLGKAIRCLCTAPPVWVQMSTAHIYGDPPSAICTEDSACGCGLAPFVAKAWEDAFHVSVLPSQRAVILRTGFVLGRDRGAGGGALSTLRTMTRLGLGGQVGGGRQGMSWIHEFDLHRLMERALTQPEMRGVYIASAPNPLSQATFMREMRRAVGIPCGLPASEWLVRIAVPLLLRTDPELILYGRYVVSQRLAEEQFPFRFAELRPALNDLLRTTHEA